MKRLIIILIAAAAVFGLIFILRGSRPAAGVGKDYKTAVYEIEGGFVELKNGIAETEQPGSAAKTVTKYFGNEIKGDFNNDGKEDVAFLITQERGGSGTLYYVVASLDNGNTYKGTNGIFLGDRIAPQSTEFRNGEIVVNFAERKAREAMTVAPSVAVTKYFKIQNGKLVEIVKEGAVEGADKG